MDAAVGDWVSAVEELIPTLQKAIPVVYDEPFDPLNLRPAEAVTVLQSDRLKPELRLCTISLNMHVRRLFAVGRVEIKPVWSTTKNGWHC